MACDLLTLASASGLVATFLAAFLTACLWLCLDLTVLTRPLLTVTSCFAKPSTTSLALALGFALK